MRPRRPSVIQHSNQLNASDSAAFVIASGREAEDQSDEDDDDDEDQEDESGDGNEVADVGKSINKGWQENPLVDASAPPRKVSSVQATSQSSPLCLPAQSGLQWPFEPWSEDSAIYSSAFPPFDFVQNGYSDHNFNMSVLPGFETDCTTTPVSLHPYHHHKLDLPQATFAHNPACDPTLDILMNCMNYTSQIDPIVKNNSPPEAQGISSPDSSTQKDNSPTQYQGLMDHESVTQGQSPGYSKAQDTALSSRRNLLPITPLTPSPDGALQHVSIDAVCTTEELGNIMRTLVGLAKSVTVKVNF
jgi:hypothetical protein